MHVKEQMEKCVATVVPPTPSPTAQVFLQHRSIVMWYKNKKAYHNTQWLLEPPGSRSDSWPRNALILLCPFSQKGKRMCVYEQLIKSTVASFYNSLLSHSTIFDQMKRHGIMFQDVRHVLIQFTSYITLHP